MRVRLIVAVLAMAGLSGCGGAMQSDPWSTFNTAEYIPYAQPGTGVVQGQAHYVESGRELASCAGKEVLLAPDTLAVHWDLSRMAFGKKPSNGMLFKADALGVVKRAVCDADGKFSIPGVPPGRWILATRAWWKKPQQNGSYLIVDILVTFAIKDGTVTVPIKILPPPPGLSPPPPPSTNT